MLLLEKLLSSFQLNVHHVAESCTVKPLYYRQLAAIYKCLGYQSVLIIQFSLYAKVPFRTTAMCVDYAGVLIFSSVLIKRLHSITV